MNTEESYRHGNINAGSVPEQLAGLDEITAQKMTGEERALRLAIEAGHILLENGAEIGRVENTMEHIASSYGVNDGSFFVLSNGIIATGQHYASAAHIPIRGMQLSRVVEVNQLSREVTGGTMPLDELDSRLKTIRASKGKPWWEVILGIAFGVSSFSILFGGSLTDAVATFVCGLLLGAFMTFVGTHLSRIFSNLLGGLLGGLLCILSVNLGFGDHLPNMIIGTIIALVPGVPFTNGMLDIANEAYIAGSTRLKHAFLAFLCIAAGVALAFILEGLVSKGLMQIGMPTKDALTSAWYIQLPAAFIGTVGFSALFGTPRKYYLYCGLAGMMGWCAYLWVETTGAERVVAAAFCGALTVAMISSVLAVILKCPTTVFLICGIIPLVPGGGIFWTAYYLVGDQLRQAATMGFTALKVTIAIAGGIILINAISGRLHKRHRGPGLGSR